MSSNERVAELLSLWEQAREAGRDLSFEELCAETPEVASDLRRQMKMLLAFEAWVDPARTVEHVADQTDQDYLPTIPDYEVIGRVGRGGMGEVFAARNLALDRTQAVKLMKPGLMLGSLGEARFRREMRLQARLDHPNVLPIFESRLVDNQPCFVMPLAAGGSLTDRLSECRNDHRAAAVLIEQVARGLHHAHQHGILHRDLKPSNILLSETGRPMVADFGIATLFDTDDEVAETASAEATPPDGNAATRFTRTGDRVGTIPYMAPEQIRGERARFGPGVDVWAMGVILYCMVSGQMPFGLTADEGVEARILMTDPAPLDGVDPRLEAIIRKCLRKEPAERYASAAAFADDLKRWLDPKPGRRLTPVIGLLAVIVTGGLALVVLPSPSGRDTDLRPPPTLEQSVRKATHDLANGRRVTLVGDAVLEPRYQVEFGNPRRLNPAARGSPNGLRFASEGHSLIELLPKVPVSDFRIEAEIGYEHLREGARNPLVGIYAARHGFVDPDGLTHHTARCLIVGERDTREKDQATPTAYSQAWCIGEALDRPLRIIENFRDMPEFVAGKSPEKEPIRRIAMEFRGGDLAGYWDDKPEPFIRVDEDSLMAHARGLTRFLRRRFPELDGMTVSYDPYGGGLGVCVRDCAVFVRRLTVEPLEP